MECKVKVLGKAQNRIALGIINAYLQLHPESNLVDLREAFPNTINPDCGSKQIFMTEKDINHHISNGEEWYATARGYFVKDDEWLNMPDGERVGFVSMWTKPSMERLVEQAKVYGIDIEESDEKRGTFRLVFLDENRVVSDSIDREDGELKTYHLRIEDDTFYRIDVVGLENASDEDIEEVFVDNDNWAEIVGDTQLLYSKIEDIANAIEDGDYGYVGDDEEAARKIMDMVGDSVVSASLYFPDATEDYRIVVLDEDDEEIDVIEEDDICVIRFEDGSRYSSFIDEDDDSYQPMKEYLERNNLDEDSLCNDFEMCKSGWSWVNVQSCEMDVYPVYELQTKGIFDARKLSVKKVLVEESLKGITALEVITKILYDGEELIPYDSGSTLDEVGRNFFVKREEEADLPEVVYDFTNMEKE